MNIDQKWLQQQFPDFSNLTPLGQGGQKVVLSGDHTTDGEVVLKLFHLATDPERVMREVQAVQNIQSDHVPKILDVGQINATVGRLIWVREERVYGDDLRRALSNGSTDPRTALSIGRDVLEALATAENARIVHRDVKPENIMATHDNGYYLLDFGLARHLDEESLTATAHAFGMGTPGYAPPEQFRNRKSEIDARSDLFALGVTLYEWVEGVNPYIDGARDLAERIRRVETQPLPPISRTVDAQSEFQELLIAMTRVRRDHRPPTARAALMWMQEICAAEGV